MKSLKIIRSSLPILLIVLLTHSSHSLLTSASNFIRGLKSGDSFTPGELLPLALKLLSKIEVPGSGKGIISISKSAEDLADRLFESFFKTTKRFVTLTDSDIQRLDALQALALRGDATNNGENEYLTEEPVDENAEMLRVPTVKVNTGGLKSKYTLLRKNITAKVKVKRRGIELAKKLNTKRRLVVKGRKNNPNIMNATKPNCRWRYECRRPGDLDSCQLHTRCDSNDTTASTSISANTYIGPQKHVDPKEGESMKTLRKRLGLTEVDEEVEKILESGTSYANDVGEAKNNGVESLSEYFNNIIMAQAVLESTTAVVDNYMNAQPEGSNEPTESEINSENSQNRAAWRSVNMKERHTEEDDNASDHNIDTYKRRLYKKRQF